MIYNERNHRKEYLLQVARQVMTAARTAPKSKGIDIIEIVAVSDDLLKKLANKMVEISDETGLKFLLRDANNILDTEVVLLIGTKIQTHGLNCGNCGFSACDEKLKFINVPCELNSIDLGIALGSAVTLLADLRIDNRIMFSAGLAAKKLNLINNCHSVYAILMSISSKNPYFDRKSPENKNN